MATPRNADQPHRQPPHLQHAPHPVTSALPQKLPRRRRLRHPARHVHGPRHHDGHGVVAPRRLASQHPALHQRPLLRQRLHELHGRRVRARVPRGPRLVRERVRQRPVRADEFLGREFLDWVAVSVCDCGGLFGDCVLVDWVAADGDGVLHVGHVVVFGSRGGGVVGRAGGEFGARFRGGVGGDGVCEWVVDERGRVFGDAGGVECFLEICVSLC